MENVVPYKIQIISIIGAVLFMLFVFRLIIKRKLKIEYAILWMLCTVVLLVFAIWRNGLDVIAHMLGVFYAPALIFLGAIFAIVIFLVHMSVVNTKQEQQIKDLAQQLALLKEELEKNK